MQPIQPTQNPVTPPTFREGRIILSDGQIILPLSKAHHERIEHHTNPPSTSIWERIKRTAFSFFSSGERYSYQPKDQIMHSPHLLALIGSQVGMLGSLILTGPAAASLLPVTVAKTVGQAALTAGIGALSGGILLPLGGKIFVEAERVSHEMSAEHLKKTVEEVFPIFHKVLQEEPSMKPFICPLTETLIIHPLKDPRGQHYERSKIVEFLQKKKEKFPPEVLKRIKDPKQVEEIKNSFSPDGSGYMSLDDLEPAPEYHKEVFRTLHKIIEKAKQEHEQALEQLRKEQAEEVSIPSGEEGVPPRRIQIQPTEQIHQIQRIQKGLTLYEKVLIQAQAEIIGNVMMQVIQLQKANKIRREDLPQLLGEIVHYYSIGI